MGEYAERDTENQKHYIKHVSAMTSEKLHSKADIAAELAHRDELIDDLLAKQEGKMLVPARCCTACKRWRYTNSGLGECEELNAWDEGFYCKGFSETKEGKE